MKKDRACQAQEAFEDLAKELIVYEVGQLRAIVGKYERQIERLEDAVLALIGRGME